MTRMLAAIGFREWVTRLGAPMLVLMSLILGMSAPAFAACPVGSVCGTDGGNGGSGVTNAVGAGGTNTIANRNGGDGGLCGIGNSGQGNAAGAGGAYAHGGGGGGSDSGGGGGGGNCGGMREGGGGGGAGGGEGQILNTSGDLVSSLGGNGGVGGNGSSAVKSPGGGGGGGGGSGAAVGAGLNAHVPLGVTLQGGSAGGGGGSLTNVNGTGGFGGNGVSVGSGAFLVNDGSIIGGSSGVGNQGGAGVAGSDVAITLGPGSVLSGGLGGAVRANAVTFAGGANTLALDGGALTGDLAISSGTLAFNQSGSRSLSNVITGAGAVIDNAAGALAFTAANTYTGGTTVSNGSLLASNTSGSATGTGPVTVSGGSLAGVGTVSGVVTLSGGSVAPGDTGSPYATLTVGGYQQTGGSLGIVSDGVANSRLAVTGTSALGGTLSITFSTAPSIGQSFTVLTSIGAISGTFATTNLSGAPGLSAQITYNQTSVVVTIAGPATHFAVVAATPVVSYVDNGSGLAVTALDVNNQTATGYTGTVHFASSDPGAAVPADATLGNGTGTFDFGMKQAGIQTITVTDTATPAITGTSNQIQVNPGPTSRFIVSAPASATAGAAFNFSVGAADLYGNTTPMYAGTVHFTSSDGAATLPADAVLSSGSGTFGATLRTPPSQTIVATDTASAAISGTSAAIAMGKLTQTITFGAASVIQVNGTGTVTATTTATPSASYPITFATASLDCSVTGMGVVTGNIAGTGNCIINASQAGDGIYDSATATQTLSIVPVAQAVPAPALDRWALLLLGGLLGMLALASARVIEKDPLKKQNGK